jgi:hypothetical protein
MMLSSKTNFACQIPIEEILNLLAEVYDLDTSYLVWKWREREERGEK